MRKFDLVEIDGETYAMPNKKYQEILSQKKYDLFLKNSNIPSFYWDINFKDYKGNKESKEYKSIIYYANHLAKFTTKHVHLYLYGINSSQKTALAINILKEGIKKGLKVQFILAGQLIDMLMKLQGFKNDEELESKVKKLKESDVICIDDVFDPNKTLMWKKSESKNMIISEWDIFLRNIISSDTKIIMTSNFNLEIIEQYYSKSLYELIERNFALLELTESVKEVRKSMVQDIFKHIK